MNRQLSFIMTAIIVFGFSFKVWSQNIDAKLGGATSAEAFFVTDNAATPDTLFTIQGDGNVGIGTPSPGYLLDVVGPGSGEPTVRYLYNNFQGGNVYFRMAETNFRGGYLRYDATNNDFHIGVHDPSDLNLANDVDAITIDRATGNVGMGVVPTNPLQMASGAYVSSGGVWTNASSRGYKEKIRELSFEDALCALEQLSPVRYQYKQEQGEEYLGFIAEDVPSLVATGNRMNLNPMDIVAVLTSVVKMQQKKILELELKIENLTLQE
jgi:hypothetical protein